MPTRKLIRKFQLGFCRDWIEIYERTPRPKDQGEFSLAFRERFGRKVLPLFCGITAYGAKVLAEDLKLLRYDPTGLLLLIERKRNERPTNFVPLAVR